MATTPPNDPHRTTIARDPAVEPGYVDPAARRDPAYREPVTTEDHSSGGMGKWVMIALAALAVALLVSFFVGGDADVEEASTTVIESDADVAVIEDETAPAATDEGTVAVVETEEPILENAEAETVPLGEEVSPTDTAAAPVTEETPAETTDTAAAPVVDEAPAETETAVIETETPAEGEATETAATPLTEETSGTDATETGSIEVETTDAETPAADGELEFREVEVQSAN